MDIHKPKPWHGVREFLKEYLIIVVGVLTALGAEAVVERFHEQRVAKEAREAVRGEIAADLGWMMRRREEQACDDRRLDELSAILAAAREGRPFQAPQWVGRTLNVPVSTRRWTAASQAGRATMFGSGEQGRYATLYFTLEGFAGHQDQEQFAWATLRTLEGAKTLSPAMIWGLSEALSRARMESYMVKRATTRSLAGARALGISPAPQAGTAADVNQYPSCIAMSTDRATALRLVANPDGEP
jgi:hypothetical protein